MRVICPEVLTLHIDGGPPLGRGASCVEVAIVSRVQTAGSALAARDRMQHRVSAAGGAKPENDTAGGTPSTVGGRPIQVAVQARDDTGRYLTVGGAGRGTEGVSDLKASTRLADPKQGAGIQGIALCGGERTAKFSLSFVGSCPSVPLNPKSSVGVGDAPARTAVRSDAASNNDRTAGFDFTNRLRV